MQELEIILSKGFPKFLRKKHRIKKSHNFFFIYLLYLHIYLMKYENIPREKLHNPQRENRGNQIIDHEIFNNN